MTDQNTLFERFDIILRDIIAPRLKALQFSKRAGTFSRPLPDFSQIVNIQKSQWNHEDSVRFTVNIGFYSDDIHQQIFSFPTPKNPKEHESFLRFRSGSITQLGNEWYELDSTKPWTQCADALASDLDGVILSLLEQITTFDKLAEFWINNEWLQKQTPVLSRYIILQRLGFGDRAFDEFADLYSGALYPKDSITIINYPDGRSETRTSKGKRSQEFIDHLEKFARLNKIELKGITSIRSQRREESID